MCSAIMVGFDYFPEVSDFSATSKPHFPSLTMPIYAYACDACGHAQDHLQKMSDARLTVCPACGKASYTKQLTAAGFQLKGSGWYVTDFRDNGKKEAGTEAAKKAAAGDAAKSKTESASSGDAAKSGSDGGSSASSASSSTPSPAPAPAPAPTVTPAGA